MASFSLTSLAFSEGELQTLRAALAWMEDDLADQWHFQDHAIGADIVMISLENDLGRNLWDIRHQIAPEDRLVACTVNRLVEADWKLCMAPGLPPSRQELIRLLNTLSEHLNSGIKDLPNRYTEDSAAETAEMPMPDDATPPEAAGPIPPPTAALSPIFESASVSDLMMDTEKPRASWPDGVATTSNMSAETAPPKEEATIHLVQPPDELAEEDDSAFEPEEYLIGVLQKVVAAKTNAVFKAEGLLVLVSPELGEYYAVDPELDVLTPLCRTKIRAIQGKTLTREELLRATRSGKLKARPLAELRWHAALIASRGRLWPDCRMTDTVRLQQWPQLSHLHRFHDYLPVAVFMHTHTADIYAIAEETETDIKQILDFHNACHALGMIERGTFQPWSKKAVPPSLRDVYRNIARRLADLDANQAKIKSAQTSGQPFKLVFVGDTGAGKSTAVRAITGASSGESQQHPSFQRTQDTVVIDLHYSDLSTDDTSASGANDSAGNIALDYGELTLNDGKKLCFYGMPSQRELDFTCHIFTRSALGLIILVNNANNDPLSELSYQLKLNADFLAKGSAVIGVTHYDEASRPSVEQYCRFLHRKGLHWPVVPLDPRKRGDIAMLIHVLLAVMEYG